MLERKRLIFFPILAVLLAGAAALAQSQEEGSTEPIHGLWSRPLKGLVALAVSPDGERVITADREGQIRAFNPEGQSLWQQSLPGVDHLSTSQGGSLTLAYAAHRPLVRRALLIGDDGQVLRAIEMQQAIESGLVAPDARSAVIATTKSLLFCAPDPKGLRTRPVPLKAEPEQIQLGPGDGVYVASQNPPAVMLVKSSGKVLWTREMDRARIRSISANEDGRLLAITEKKEDEALVTTVVNASNEKRWTDPPPGQAPRRGRAPHLRLCADGSSALLTYEHKVEHQLLSRYERRLAYLGGPENRTWDKGGGYTAPVAVSMDRKGEWLVALDTQQEAAPARFRLYDRRGHRLWIYSCPTEVWIATGSLSGRYIAAYRADGVLEYLAVNPPR